MSYSGIIDGSWAFRAILFRSSSAIHNDVCASKKFDDQNLFILFSRRMSFNGWDGTANGVGVMENGIEKAQKHWNVKSHFNDYFTWTWKDECLINKETASKDISMATNIHSMCHMASSSFISLVDAVVRLRLSDERWKLMFWIPIQKRMFCIHCTAQSTRYDRRHNMWAKLLCCMIQMNFIRKV